jgi:hypothetical protein
MMRTDRLHALVMPPVFTLNAIKRLMRLSDLRATVSIRTWTPSKVGIPLVTGSHRVQVVAEHERRYNVCRCTQRQRQASDSL